MGRKLSHLKSLSDNYIHYKIDLEKVTQSEKEFGRLIKENPEVSGFVHCVFLIVMRELFKIIFFFFGFFRAVQ